MPRGGNPRRRGEFGDGPRRGGCGIEYNNYLGRVSYEMAMILQSMSWGDLALARAQRMQDQVPTHNGIATHLCLTTLNVGSGCSEQAVPGGWPASIEGVRSTCLVGMNVGAIYTCLRSSIPTSITSTLTVRMLPFRCDSAGLDVSASIHHSGRAVCGTVYLHMYVLKRWRRQICSGCRIEGPM